MNSVDEGNHLHVAIFAGHQKLVQFSIVLVPRRKRQLIALEG